MNFKSFLISKIFFKQLAIMSGVLVILLLITIKALDIYTDNGKFIVIPKLQDRDADSLMLISTPKYLQYVIIDSVYNENSMPGTVVLQNPKPGAKVKKGRKVYLSVVAKMPEMVAMPNLIDLSIRRAIDVLEYAHLKVGRISFKDDIALNAVLYQLYKGDTIQPDSLIPSGSQIHLIAGNGFNKTGVSVPFLIGKTLEQAQDIILKSSFNLGDIDTLWENYETNWRVYAQDPPVDPRINELLPLGSRISIKIRSALGYDFDSVKQYYQLPDSLRNDSLFLDPDQTETSDF